MVVSVPVGKIYTLFNSHPKTFFQTNGKHLRALKDLPCDENPTGVQRSNHITSTSRRVRRACWGFFKITNKLEHTSTSIAEDFPQWAIFKFPIRHAVCLVACVADARNLLYWLYKWLRQVRGLAATQAICLADILKFILGSEVRGIKPNHMYYSLLNLKMISFVLFPG